MIGAPLAIGDGDGTSRWYGCRVPLFCVIKRHPSGQEEAGCGQRADAVVVAWPHPSATAAQHASESSRPDVYAKSCFRGNECGLYF